MSSGLRKIVCCLCVLMLIGAAVSVSAYAEEAVADRGLSKEEVVLEVEKIAEQNINIKDENIEAAATFVYDSIEEVTAVKNENGDV